MASCVPLPHQTSLLQVVPKPHALQVRPQLTALSRSSAVLRRLTYSGYGCVTDRQGLTLSSRGMAKATWKPHLSNAAEPNGYSPVAALQRSLAGGLWPFKLLSGVVRPEKLGIDPTLQAIALHLDPVPLPVCNLEPRAFAGGPNNSPVSRWRRSDVYARTL